MDEDPARIEARRILPHRVGTARPNQKRGDERERDDRMDIIADGTDMRTLTARQDV